MSKRSCKAAESIEDAIHDNRMFAERSFFVLRMARVNYSSVALSFVLIHFRYALMKGSRPPSSTPSAFATS